MKVFVKDGRYKFLKWLANINCHILHQKPFKSNYLQLDVILVSSLAFKSNSSVRLEILLKIIEGISSSSLWSPANSPLWKNSCREKLLHTYGLIICCPTHGPFTSICFSLASDMPYPFSFVFTCCWYVIERFAC